MFSNITQNPSSTKGTDDDGKRAREDNDPQTIFYLNSILAGSALQEAPDASKEDILITLYLWATKIEHTVQSKLGDGSMAERYAIQASWDRASYRAKLLDYLTRTTPWLMMTRDNQATPADEELTGEYHHDKLVYQKAIHNFLQEKLTEIPVEKLQIMERYITETMVLGQDKLVKVLRFALAFPLLIGEGPSVQSGLRVMTFAFEKKTGDEGNATAVTISKTLYQASLNKRLFDEQQFDQKLLEAGKALVLDATFDVIVER